MKYIYILIISLLTASILCAEVDESKLTRVWSFIRYGQYDKAEELLKELYNKHPDDGKVFEEYFSLLAKTQRFSAADSLISQSLIPETKKHFYYIRLHGAKGDLIADHIEPYLKSLKFDDEYLELSAFLMNSGSGSLAINALKKGIEKFPGNFEMRKDLLLIFLEIKDYTQYLDNLLDLYILEKNFDTADYYMSLLAGKVSGEFVGSFLAPKFESHQITSLKILFANFLAADGQYERALEMYKVNIDPGSYPYYLKLADKFISLSKNEYAKTAFERYLEFNPKDNPVRFRLIEILLQLGLDNKILENAQVIINTGSPEDKCRIYSFLGSYNLDKEDFDSALENYNMLSVIYPGIKRKDSVRDIYYSSLEMSGRIHFRNGNTEKAGELFGKIGHETEGLPLRNLLLTKLYFITGKEKEMSVLLEKAASTPVQSSYFNDLIELKMELDLIVKGPDKDLLKKLYKNNMSMEYEKTTALYSDSIQVSQELKPLCLWLFAENFLLTKNVNKAIDLYIKTGTQYPDSYLASGSLYKAGYLLLEQGKREQARSLFLMILKDHPHSAVVSDTRKYLVWMDGGKI